MTPPSGPDIVDRLREQHGYTIQYGIGWGACSPKEAPRVATIFSEAAAEIERLRSCEAAMHEGSEIIIELKQEVDRLRALTSPADGDEAREEAIAEAARFVAAYESHELSSSGQKTMRFARALLSHTPEGGWRAGVEAAAKVCDALAKEAERRLTIPIFPTDQNNPAFEQQRAAALKLAIAIRALSPPPTGRRTGDE